MKTLGLSLGNTQNGRTLKDGAACIMEDGRIIVAVAEERVSRIKHAGGFRHALRYCLDVANLSLDDFNAIVVSSCCEDVCPRNIDDLSVRDADRIHFIPSHHLSHAYSTFCVSPFDQALIVVMDGGGNIIGQATHPDWWRNPREQNSYFIGQGNSIELIRRDFDEPYDVGFGEAYRCFTYYLGWPSSAYAGNTMALASYGDPDRFKGLVLLEAQNGRLKCKLRNDPPHPITMLERYAQETGVHLGEPRRAREEILQHHKDLAFFIQNQLEEALVGKIRSLCRETGLTNLCIAGGVGLNCVANARILEDTPVRNLFIQPAASDQGQALGNALYGNHALLGQARSEVMRNAYLGREYSLNQVGASLNLLGSTEFEIARSPDIVRDTARLIADGFIVGWFQGRSEFGPRALGNRSILADPRRPEIKNRLDEAVKRREWFRPYAPSVLVEHVQEFFEPAMDSPFMLLVTKVRPEKKHMVPAILHVDGTARLQTVSREENPRYYALIDAYKDLTGIPLLLNTSFNGQGEPIVETSEDAIHCFKENHMDALVIGDYLTTRRGFGGTGEKSNGYR